MRYFEISSGFRVPMSNEEREIMSKVGIKGIREDEIIDEREQEVARMMMMRGLLNKKRDKDGKLVYRQNSVNDIFTGRDF